jgi:hypothetical protein
MDCNSVKKDLQVKTNDTLGSTRGMMIRYQHLALRRPNAVGRVLDYVGGHGGDVWWVQHDGDPVPAAYCFDEFEAV